jgi:hypothetical protein
VTETSAPALLKQITKKARDVHQRVAVFGVAQRGKIRTAALKQI